MATPVSCDIQDIAVDRLSTLIGMFVKYAILDVYRSVRVGNKDPLMVLREFQEGLKGVPSWERSRVDRLFKQWKDSEKIVALWTRYRAREDALEFIHRACVDSARLVWRVPNLVYHAQDATAYAEGLRKVNAISSDCARALLLTTAPQEQQASHEHPQEPHEQQESHEHHQEPHEQQESYEHQQESLEHQQESLEHHQESLEHHQESHEHHQESHEHQQESQDIEKANGVDVDEDDGVGGRREKERDATASEGELVDCRVEVAAAEDDHEYELISLNDVEGDEKVAVAVTSRKATPKAISPILMTSVPLMGRGWRKRQSQNTQTQTLDEPQPAQHREKLHRIKKRMNTSLKELFF